MFITDLMKQEALSVRVRHGVTLAPVDGADEIEIAHDLGGDEFRNTLAVSPSLKRALVWLTQSRAGDDVADDADNAVPLRDFRGALGGLDSHFGVLQTAALMFNNILTLGIIAPRGGRALADIEFSQAGRNLPDVSRPDGLADDAPLAWSRFTYLHREDDALLLSRPLKDKRLIIRDAVAEHCIVDLSRGARLSDLRARCVADAGGDEDAGDDVFAGVAALINLLYREEFIVAAVDARPPARLEEGDAAMQQWDFHDAVSHANSRLGFNFGFDFGGAFPFVDIIAPRPAVKELPAGARIALYKPDLQTMAAADKPLTAIVNQRMSVRAYNEDAPVSLKQLGEFLFRTGRVLFAADVRVANLREPSRQTDMGLAWRPYPTGGASYELEFYLTVDRADGIDPGIYYYAPAIHKLIKLSARNAYTDGLIETAFASCARIVRPQVVVHVAARFQRVSWKYHNIAYATMLRNTGVVYQTFYLHAVAMNLAGCGLGSGNTDLFCRATGNAPHIECNIGEFMLGSLPAGFDYDAIDLEAGAAMHDAKLAPSAF